MEKNEIKTALFVQHGATLGGASLCLFEILKRIDKTKYRILVVLPEEGPLSDLLEKEGIRYKIIPLFNFYYCSQSKTRLSLRNLFILVKEAIGNIIYLSRILKKENPDVVIINPSTLLLSGLIAKLMGKRVIWHVREVISTEKSWFLKKIIASIIRFSAEKVIVASRFSLKDMLNLKLRNAIVVYDGAVDLKRFRKRNVSDEEFARFVLNPDDKVVGFVGQIYKEKGWVNLLQAAFLLVQKLPRVKFLIVGSSCMIERKGVKYTDPLRKYREDALFHKIVKDMKLDSNFIFLGQRFDVENILPLMSCLVFTSIVPEAFGRVMVEAMACGLPVVASDISAVPEIVVHNETGLLVKPNNPKALSDALINILTNEKKAKDMGNAGRRRIESLFDIEKILPQLMEIYKI